MSNATRFISAYNKLDKVMRNKFHLKNNITFTECVRLAASRNPVARKYEDDLMDYGRLRNAIVHKSDTDMVIAEPHDSAVEMLEHILQLISIPPRADLTVAKPAVTLSAETVLVDAIRLMAKSNISNVPVLGKTGVIAGVANNKLIVEAIARNLSGDLDAFVRSATIGSTLSDLKEHYALARADITVDCVLQLFSQQRKLQIVVLTRNGSADSDIAGVVTTGDIMAMNKMLE